MRIMLLVALGLVVLGLGAAAGFFVSAWRELPALTNVEPRIQATSFVYDRNGELVTGLAGAVNRIPVDLAIVPKHVQEAFVAQEDHSFYSHHGFVLRRILAAAYADLTGGLFQGASTITQQLARTAFLNLDRTLTRKLQEVILAVQMERLYTKDELLEMYLNLINLGAGYGVQAAAQNYFGKDVSELNLAEGAMLAGMAPSPGTYSPYRNLELSLKRTRQVLAQMVKRGYITQEQSDEAAAYEFQLPGIPDRTEYPHPFFVDYILEQLFDVYGLDTETVYSGGLRVYTTLDPVTQAAAEAAVAKYSPNFPTNSKDERAEMGLVVMENDTGYLRAIVGGVEHTQTRQFNFATESRRQPGSAFKPIVDYTPAIDLGYSPSTAIDDAPLTLFTLSGESWMPSNYSPRFLGLINFRSALERSINTPAVRVLHMIGIRTGLEYARRMGIDGLVTEGTINDVTNSLALGALTHGVSALEMARAYGVLANEGVKVQPIALLKVIDRYGHVLIDNQPRKEVVVSKQTAWLVTDMLVGVIQNPSGTGTRARLEGWTAAGKTGTSEDHADAWFAGYTARHTCAVWLGYPKERLSMGQTVGGMYPALVWKETMTAAHEGLEPVGFERPPEIVEAAVCRKSGKLPGPNCPAADVVLEVFLQGHEPTERCTTHVSARICLDDPTHLATPSCPAERTAWRTFIKREPYVPWITSKGVALIPEDAQYELPTEPCRYHQPPPPFVPDREIELTMSGNRFNPSEIRVAPGTNVRLKITSVGRTYSIAIDGYALSAICGPGETTYLDFVAKAGTYYYYCNMDTNDERSKMMGRLIVSY
jgi:penicillin-binding protein 1A